MDPIIIPILGISCGLLAVFGGIFILPMYKLKEKRMAMEADRIAEKAAQYATNQAVLEERVAVLERIITDQGYSLAKEIEELRSLPPRQITPKPDLV